ncbi:MAG TPA: phosphodiester glycosidase family protein [Actinomycetota bacterium]|nr:phosphodiester glycosidase family protein [Actinomycetota bacterium]
MPRSARLPRSVRLALALVLLAALGAALAPAAGGAGRYRTLVSRRVAPGLHYRVIKDARGPNRILVLTVDLSAPLTLDVALAGDRLGLRERTSSMARRHGALAAVNGDFGSLSNRPAFGFAMDGELVSSSLAFGYDVAVSYDEADVYLGHPRFSLTATEASSGERWGIRRWNDPVLSFGEVGGYTSRGGSLATPPPYACSARLLPGLVSWADGERGVVTDLTVDRAGCEEAPLAANGGMVLSALPGSPEAETVRALQVGDRLRVAWSFGWRGVLDVLGGTPLLLRDGRRAVEPCSASLCRRHPRTGVGVRADGRLLLVVVDGRRPGYSVGMTLVEFAELFRWLGAVDALNLDGGGSSTMVVRGDVKNRPCCDGSGERRVVNALLVLPGPDPEETVPAPAGTEATTAAAPAGAALDGGSTGGLADALEAGALGGTVSMAPDLGRAAELFEAQRTATPSSGR